jgi:predicted dehydrogenase
MTSPSQPVRFGIVGGGLMGKEIAAALARWFALTGEDVPRAELVAVCDSNPQALSWFERVPTVKYLYPDADALFACPDVDVVYIALPHQLHEDFYLRALRAGKDLLAEKPFGIDLRAAQSIRDEAQKLGRFVRCSSEFPFFPGAQRVWKLLSENRDSLGRILEIRAGFHHSSDLDASKPANWKRQNATCGEAGVMNDLGLHVAHLPLRLGWKPQRVYAQLQRGYELRPDGRGGSAVCDTWDNALLHCDVEIEGREVPMRWEMKRLSPGEMNTWFLEVLGTEGGAKFSTKTPKTLQLFESGKEQSWKSLDVGHVGAFGTVTGGIFEFGFSDSILQMFASFCAERAGALNGRLGMVTPQEAVSSHEVWNAALASQHEKRAVEVAPAP